MEYKTCTKCGESLPATLEFFHKLRNGLRPQCKTCRSENAHKRREDPEYCEKERQRFCEYRRENRELCNQRGSKYRKNNLEKVAAYEAKRRARKLNQTPEFTESERYRVELIYKKSHELGPGWQVDHKIPLSKHGPHHPDNLQIVTKTYNQQKSDKLNFRNPFEWEIYNYDMG